MSNAKDELISHNKRESYNLHITNLSGVLQNNRQKNMLKKFALVSAR